MSAIFHDMLKPDELQLLGLMLDRLRSGCTCLTIAERNLVIGMTEVLHGNRPQNLYPQQFTLIEKLHGRCTAGRCAAAPSAAQAAVPAGSGDGA
ncbi:MAG TPA: hypothetical protein VGD08_20815 [Stellaceae bacterium]